MEEGRFPRSTLSNDRKRFTLNEIEADTFERPKSTRTRSIRFLYVTDAENSFCHLPAFHLVSILPRILRIQLGKGWRSRTLALLSPKPKAFTRTCSTGLGATEAGPSTGRWTPLARSGSRSPIVVGSSPSPIPPMAATSPGKAEACKRWPGAPLWDEPGVFGVP